MRRACPPELFTLLGFRGDPSSKHFFMRSRHWPFPSSSTAGANSTAFGPLAGLLLAGGSLFGPVEMAQAPTPEFHGPLTAASKMIHPKMAALKDKAQDPEPLPSAEGRVFNLKVLRRSTMQSTPQHSQGGNINLFASSYMKETSGLGIGSRVFHFSFGLKRSFRKPCSVPGSRFRSLSHELRP